MMDGLDLFVVVVVVVVGVGVGGGVCWCVGVLCSLRYCPKSATVVWLLGVRRPVC